MDLKIALGHSVVDARAIRTNGKGNSVITGGMVLRTGPMGLECFEPFGNDRRSCVRLDQQKGKTWMKCPQLDWNDKHQHFWFVFSMPRVCATGQLDTYATFCY